MRMRSVQTPQHLNYMIVWYWFILFLWFLACDSEFILFRINTIQHLLLYHLPWTRNFKLFRRNTRSQWRSNIEHDGLWSMQLISSGQKHSKTVLGEELFVEESSSHSSSTEVSTVQICESLKTNRLKTWQTCALGCTWETPSVAQRPKKPVDTSMQEDPTRKQCDSFRETTAWVLKYC